VAYTGTHDNETVVGWYQNATLSDKNNCDKYLASMKEIESNEINWKFIEAVWSTKSVLAIAQMQDVIGLDNSARMNKPATIPGNWKWRLKKGEINSRIIERLAKLTSKNGR
ncbi:MAG: 4-alpha-glucanotransferase, partial [Fusobacteriaceae bacterium]